MAISIIRRQNNQQPKQPISTLFSWDEDYKNKNSYIFKVFLYNKSSNKQRIEIYQINPLSQSQQKVGDLRNIGSIEYYKIFIREGGQYLDEIMQSLSREIGKKRNMQQLSIYNGSLNDAQITYLCNCFSIFLTTLHISFDDITQFGIQEIALKLQKLTNLTSFQLKIKNNNNTFNLTKIYKAFRSQVLLKRLSISKNSIKKVVKTYDLMSHLPRCEYLKLPINDFNWISTFKQAEQLKSLCISLSNSQQSQLDRFSQVHTPNLLGVKILEFKLLEFDEAILQFMILTISNLNQLNKLVITKLLFQDNQFKQILSIFPFNTSITTFSFKFEIKQGIQFEIEDILKLKHLKHLDLKLCYCHSNIDRIKLLKYFSKLDNLLSLQFPYFKSGEQKYLIHAKRLVQYN